MPIATPVPMTATVTLCSRVHPTAEGATPGQIMVVEAGSSSIVELPRSGQLLIGRAPDCQVRLQDPQVSRQHARLDILDEEVTLVDLGSHNGTRVNGERIARPRRLLPGDVLSLCDVSLLFSRPKRGVLVRPIYDTPEPLRARLEEEAERALHTRRASSVLAVRLAEPLVKQRQKVAEALSPLLHIEDVLAMDQADTLVILRPDADEEDAQKLAAQLMTALAAFAPLRVGYACCPSDGYDVDALLEGARSAAGQAAPAQVLSATRAMTTLRVGDRAVVVADPAMVRLYALIERLAQSDLPVLVCGETGSGKEIAAQVLHASSKRRGQRLISINCAALPESLAESELFGHEKGAFSGAVATKIGLLESAQGGTVFFDELGELSLALQAKLLRALETKKIVRVGDTRERSVDFRIVAATNRRLLDEVAAGRFRQDLYFRLSTAVLTMPPLRERQRELPILARTFLGEACVRAGRDPVWLSPATMDVLLRYRWPGNLRELRNTMDYAATVVSESVVEPMYLPDTLLATVTPPSDSSGEGRDVSLRQLARIILRLPMDNKLDVVESALVQEALRLAEGNKSAAARLLGVHRRVIERRNDKYKGSEG